VAPCSTTASRTFRAATPDLDVGLLHLGGTRVMGILVTMDAGQGLNAMRLLV